MLGWHTAGTATAAVALASRDTVGTASAVRADALVAPRTPQPDPAQPRRAVGCRDGYVLGAKGPGEAPGQVSFGGTIRVGRDRSGLGERVSRGLGHLGCVH